jgi:very-short-patch-repair endonuclease
MASGGTKRRDDGRNVPIDLRIAAVAERQHGLIRLDQLVAIGLSASAVRSRVATGRLHRVHRTVYTAGRRSLSRRGTWLAAVFAVPGSALSHLAGAAHRELWKPPGVIDLSVARRVRRRPGPIRIHHVKPFHPEDLEALAGIRCTSVARIAIDIAPMVGQRGVERLIAEAHYKGCYDRAALERAVARNRGRPGIATVRNALATTGVERTRTNRELEERFLALTRSAGLPLPLVNERVRTGSESFLCDFVWPAPRLIVETDGRAAHVRATQFEEDRRRDAGLKLAGWQVVRFSWRQVTTRSDWVVSVVATLLNESG